MRLTKIKIKKYASGGFASAAGIGMEMPSPVQEIETIEKDKAARLKNVAGMTGKGAAAGAAIGSVIPGVGTAIGGAVGAVGGAIVGVFGNKKAEKDRKKANEENERLNEEMRQSNLSNWRNYARAEDNYNIQRAEDTGYDAMGNTDAQFYKKGGRLNKFPDGGKVTKTDDGSKVIDGFKLSAKELESLAIFKDDPESYKKAFQEITGFTPAPGSGNKPGSQTYQNALKAREEAQKRSLSTYNVDRSIPATKTQEAYNASKVDKTMTGPKTTTTQKTETYISTGNTELSEKAVNDAASKSVTEGGGTYEGIQYNPYDSQSYEYEKIGEVKPTEFKKGGNVYLKGGRLDQVSNNTYKAVGNSHEQGGIKLSPNAEIEGQESVTDNGDSFFVASATLRNPATGNTFAKDDIAISKKIGKFEDRGDKASMNAVKMLEAKKANLQTIQQSMNGDKEGTSMKNGGRLDKFAGGGYGYKKPTRTSGGIELAEQSQGNMTDMAKSASLEDAGIESGGSGFGSALGKINTSGVIGTVANAVGTYGGAALEYANQKKAIKRLEALKIPDPILNSYQNLGRENFDADRATVNRDVAALNTSAERGLTDSNATAAVKAANLAKGLEAKASVNQTERNVNRQISNQESQINAQTQAGNNAMLSAKNQAEFQKKADVIGMKAEAFSKLMENIRTGQNTYRQERHANTQYALDAYKLDDKQRAGLNEYMKKNNNTLYGGKQFKKGGRLSKMYC